MRIIGLCLLGTIVAFTVFAEDEPTLLYSRAPEFVSADVSSNILICEKEHVLYGYDMDSGEERWRYRLKERQNAQADPIFSNNE